MLVLSHHVPFESPRTPITVGLVAARNLPGLYTCLLPMTKGNRASQRYLSRTLGKHPASGTTPISTVAENIRRQLPDISLLHVLAHHQRVSHVRTRLGIVGQIEPGHCSTRADEDIGGHSSKPMVRLPELEPRAPSRAKPLRTP